ncbi:hypothetical protein COCON_G00033070 [Conger conger]|uniref:Uncharacterized protein n=1 Tax=Conger conger TaxID=82655 RepID=A0A9Q1I5K0_CONCO|nr:hypothetical protein COCON_G00033070 [Conger conger]
MRGESQRAARKLAAPVRGGSRLRRRKIDADCLLPGSTAGRGERPSVCLRSCRTEAGAPGRLLFRNLPRPKTDDRGFGSGGEAGVLTGRRRPGLIWIIGAPGPEMRRSDRWAEDRGS